MMYYSSPVTSGSKNPSVPGALWRCQFLVSIFLFPEGEETTFLATHYLDWLQYR